MAAEAERFHVADRVHITGYVPDASLPSYIAAADICSCLRWPTNRETSASWLRCLAAGRATIVSDLVHLLQVPTFRYPAFVSKTDEAVAVSVDVGRGGTRAAIGARMAFRRRRPATGHRTVRARVVAGSPHARAHGGCLPQRDCTRRVASTRRRYAAPAFDRRRQRRFAHAGERPWRKSARWRNCSRSVRSGHA